MPVRNNRGIITKCDVTHTAVAMEQLSKHVSTEEITRKNIRNVFFMRSVPRGYEKENEDRLSQRQARIPLP
jgi:hypothetical protein